ncbi:MAG: DUF4268 domain-containing protein [Hyphomicrobiales bacterium]|nr:DUF4268 domain-containing protein [Hyphomicrobiales bacterium]
MTAELGRLEPVPLRDVWPHEANDFTPWLAQPENLGLLAKTLNLGELSEVRTEVQVVNFFIDVLAKDDQGDSVVIENQFGPTDHRHLGQIMTYLAGQEGHVTVVWIAETFGEAHRAAIDWLNANTIDGFHFFAVQVEAWKIGASAPAPRFNVVGKPNSWTRSVSVATKTDGELHSQYAAYWAAFDAFLKEREAPFTVTEPPLTWSCRFPLGVPGVSLLASAARGNNRLAVELNFTNKTTSKAFFDQIKPDQSAIESEVGQKLEWLRQDEFILSRVAIATKAFDVSDREQWPKQFAWLLEYLLKFKAAFQDRVMALTPPNAAPPDQEAME